MKIGELDPAGWKEWVDSRPPIVRDLCLRFPPDRLYRLKTAGQRVYPIAYNEDGTLRVAVPSEFNPKRVMTGHEVFGIKPEDLEALPESESETIEAERKEMEPVAGIRNALTEAVWDPENIDLVREIVGVGEDRTD